MENSKQSNRTSAPPKAVSAKDVLQTVRIATIAVLSWVIPSRGWPRISVLLGAVDQRLRPGETARQVAEIASKLGEESHSSVRKIVRDSTAAVYEDRLQLLSEYRPGGWQPDMDLIGEEYLQAGLARGKGVILWVSYHAFSCHITKKALKNARYDVTHLSRPTHGFSSSKVGIQILNPIQTRIEERYLHERIVIGEEGSLPALMKLRTCLQQNGIVSITLGREASAFVSASFLNGRIVMPTGPIDLARLSDSTLLPLYTIRNGYWRYTTHIGPPLTSQNETAEEAATTFAAWLEPVVRQKPAHWRGWGLIETSDAPSKPGKPQNGKAGQAREP